MLRIFLIEVVVFVTKEGGGYEEGIYEEAV